MTNTQESLFDAVQAEAMVRHMLDGLSEYSPKPRIEEAMSEHYETALANWRRDGGVRPSKRPDSIPTRIDTNWMTPAERAILDAMAAVEAAGGSVALTDAVTLLSKARDRVADHVEGIQ